MIESTLVSRKAYHFKTLPPLALYVHVPWCVRKCPYCDFNSHRLENELPEQAYLDALQADLEQVLPFIWGRSVQTVFIGGGTPSLLSADAMNKVLALIRAMLNLRPDAEITMEANPGTAEYERFAAYAQAGINRISIGVQSFNDEALKKLGRIHDSQQATKAIDMALKHFKRVNLDLMFALPGQNEASSLVDLHKAFSFGTEHMSLYHLTMEPNTIFAKYPPQGLPDEDMGAQLQDLVAETAEKAGYERYEISAYAKAGAKCEHNLNYWNFGDYIGIGPGAHGKITQHDKVIRTAVVKHPDSWMQKAVCRDGSHWAQFNEVEKSDIIFEFMLNALRLKNGVSVELFQDYTDCSVGQVSACLDKAVKKGLLDADPRFIKPTALGWRFLNDLQAMFL